MTEQLTEAASGRIVKVDYFSRVEGEGGLYLRLDGDRVEELRLDIFEPPRFFEAFLQGRHFSEVPDITARVCGICPVAYQMSSVHALEAALGVTVTPAIRTLRRLMYCAEWIESHALHIFLLQAPDFLGYESGITMAKDHPELVNMGLRLKKIGNRLLEITGGRAIHPVSVCVGGFHRVPKRRALLEIRDDLVWALDASRKTVELVSRFSFPDFEPDYEFVSLSHPDEYPMNEGRIVTSGGKDLHPREFESHFLEEHVAHSNALHSVDLANGRSYFVGPLARMNLNFDRLTPAARQSAAESGVTWPTRNPFKGVVTRAIELVHCCDEALAIVNSYQEPDQPRVPTPARAGEGCAATEAPRGLLYHRYKVNAEGMIEFARIVPPTAQNFRRMEDDLRLLVPGIAGGSDGEVAAACEALVRCYDPCISCSVHFLRVKIDRG